MDFCASFSIRSAHRLGHLHNIPGIRPEWYCVCGSRRQWNLVRLWSGLGGCMHIDAIRGPGGMQWKHKRTSVYYRCGWILSRSFPANSLSYPHSVRAVAESLWSCGEILISSRSVNGSQSTTLQGVQMSENSLFQFSSEEMGSSSVQGFTLGYSWQSNHPFFSFETNSPSRFGVRDLLFFVWS